MKNLKLFLVFALFQGFFAWQVFGCHQSRVTVNGFSHVANGYELDLHLEVGRGVTGVSNGADGDTRTITLGIYGGGNLISFSPDTLVGSFTGCAMPGSIVGPVGPPYNTTNTIFYKG